MKKKGIRLFLDLSKDELDTLADYRVYEDERMCLVIERVLRMEIYKDKGGVVYEPSSRR